MARSKITFLADAMLGSVARKLRIFGFDTLYIAHIKDDDILRIGIAQERIILTSDKELFKRVIKTGARGVLVNGSDDLEDLVHILSKNGITTVDFKTMNSRCSACNGLLTAKAPSEVRKEVLGNIASRHKEFFKCMQCGKIYWEGGHLKRIRAFAVNLDTKLGTSKG